MALRAGSRRLVDAFLGDEGSTQGAVNFGLLLTAAGFLVLGWPAAALLIPGGIITFIGLVPALVKLRRGS